MGKKRFTSYYERGNEIVIEDNGKRLSNKQLVDLLNELETKCHKLKKENENLESNVRFFKNQFDKLKEKYMREEC